MSKVSISGNNSGSGTFTIAAPDSNNNRTFNLPDEAGTALTDASDLEPQVKTSLNATGDAPMFACRAFCNFDGTGTVSIRESGNVSSITDNGTGDYTVNFATAMPDANYCYQVTTSSKEDAATGGNFTFNAGSGAATLLAESLRISWITGNDSGERRDTVLNNVTIFR